MLAHGDMAATMNLDQGFRDPQDGAPPAQALGGVHGARAVDEEYVIAQLQASWGHTEPRS